MKEKKYTVWFRETRICEMQGVVAKSKQDAMCIAEHMMDSWGHENWVSESMKIVQCCIEKRSAK